MMKNLTPALTPKNIGGGITKSLQGREAGRWADRPARRASGISDAEQRRSEA